MHADMWTLLLTADVPSVTVHAGQDEHPLQPAAHRTIPNTFECTIPEGTIQAKRDYTVAIKCGNQSVNVSFTAAKCSCKYVCSQAGCYTSTYKS